jgi:hypothetical protein
MNCQRFWQRFSVFLPLSTSLLIVWSQPTLATNQPIKMKTSMSMYILGSHTEPVKNHPANPDNKNLGIETQSLSLDLRPSIKADGGQFQLIGRPLLKTYLARTKISNEDGSERPYSSARWLEAYGVLNASDMVIVSYGLQNYQWGAAESLNPSNRIFHETVDSKGLLSAVQGKNLIRVNISWNKQLTSIIMGETEPVKDAEVFRAEEVFESRTLMKHEINWNSGADYVGIVYGAQESGRPWLGEYFNLTLWDGMTLYGDAAHYRNSEAWRPIAEPSAINPPANLIQMQQSDIKSNKVHTTAVGGIRYSFAGGSDFRLEYIANTAGWSRDEVKLAISALDIKKNPQQLNDYAITLKRVLKPGLEYRGQKYGLVSLRVPDLFDVKDFNVYTRVLRSLTDGSASIYGSLEYAFWSASTFVLSAYGSTGDVDTELRGVVASNISAGIKQDF